MAIKTHKGIKPQFIAIRPMTLYKEWTFDSYDFTTQSNAASWTAVTASGTTARLPIFPALNAKYARLYPSETGSATEPDGGGPVDKIVDADGYMLSYNYTLGNNDKFYPAYQSSSGWQNPDGTYARMVHYSLQRLFYGDDGVYKHLFFMPEIPTGSNSGSVLHNEAYVIEIPQRYVAETIEPGTFVLTETSDIYNLPYSSGSIAGPVSNAYPPFDNTPLNNKNPLASDGISLTDDTRGNLFDGNYSSSVQRGNIFYELGLVIITDEVYVRYFKEYTSGSII